MKRKSFIMCIVCLVMVMALGANALASYVVSTSSVLDGDCNVTFKNSISDSKKYAYAQTVTDKSASNTSVSVTYYVLDPVSGDSMSRGDGSGGATQCGVSLTLQGNYYYYKIVSSHSATYHSLHLTRNNMVNQIFP